MAEPVYTDVDLQSSEDQAGFSFAHYQNMQMESVESNTTKTKSKSQVREEQLAKSRDEFMRTYGDLIRRLAQINPEMWYCLPKFTDKITLINVGKYLAKVRPQYELLRCAADLRTRNYEMLIHSSPYPAMDLIISTTIHCGANSYVDYITDWDRFQNSGESPAERAARLALNKYVAYADKLIKYYEQIEHDLALEFATELGSKPRASRNKQRGTKLVMPQMPEIAEDAMESDEKYIKNY